MEPELAAERTALALALMAAPLRRSGSTLVLNQQDTVVLMNDDSLEDRGLSRLPPEIWLQMLPKTTIRNITTTCRLSTLTIPTPDFPTVCVYLQRFISQSLSTTV